MTIVEQLVEDYMRQNPSATPEQVRDYIQSLEQHTKVIKEDEWAFNGDQGPDTVMNTDIEERASERNLPTPE